MRLRRLSGSCRRKRMRERQETCIVTFHTTTAAMEMERLCKAEQIPGRLIPIPRTITAGCGMCWAAPATERERIENFLIEHRVMIDGIYAVML